MPLDFTNKTIADLGGRKNMFDCWDVGSILCSKAYWGIPRWCPSSLAKLVSTTHIAMVYCRYIELVNGLINQQITCNSPLVVNTSVYFVPDGMTPVLKGRNAQDPISSFVVLSCFFQKIRWHGWYTKHYQTLICAWLFSSFFYLHKQWLPNLGSLWCWMCRAGGSGDLKRWMLRISWFQWIQFNLHWSGNMMGYPSCSC